MTNDLEYAIKQDIRNNPVVREVDRAHRRELVRTIGWAALCVALFTFALVPRASSVNSGYRIQQLRDDLARQEALQRKFRLELEVLLAPQLVQERAERELHMIEPTERDTLVIERIGRPATDSRAILASNR